VIDSIKEILALLRAIFIFLLATIFSLIAYIALHSDVFKFFLSFYALIILILIDSIILYFMVKYIKKLKDLE